MAKTADFTVRIQTELGKANQDISNLKKAGAFNSKQGAKNLNAIESLYNALAKQDFSKLSGTGLTNFLNQLAQLRKYLDSSGKSLSNFSAEYQKALKDTEKAIDAQTKAQDKYNEALKKQQGAQNRLKLDYEGTTFRNAKGNKISNPDTIAEEYNAGTLKVFNKEGTELNGAARTTRLNNTGIPEYAAATQEVDKFKQELDSVRDSLKQAKETLKGTPTGNTAHPTTEMVLGHSQDTYSAISDIKEGVGSQTENEISNASKSLEQLDVAANKTTSSFGRAFKQFTLYAFALRGLKKALSEAKKTIQELDRALTEQAMVTGLTRKQTYGLLKDYQDMASRLGTTTKEVSSTMTQFLRQGRSINESLKLTEAAVSAAKVAGISAADSINYLTTAINGFRLSADDAMKVSDKFAAVAATAATSYEEIAIALSKVAAQANLAGMSIDYTTALLTKGIETTREAPETIGTALKTVIARMREMTDYGETLEGDTNINNVEAQLSYIGIQLRDNNGELRSTEDVLNDLGGQWDTLNANQQAAIAKALAGTRQQSRLIAMMQDYERVIELQQVAERSQGATMAQMATYMEGMDAALNKVSVAWEKIVSAIADSDVIIGLINTFAGIVDGLGDFLETDGGILTTLIAISAVGLTILGNKMREIELARLQQKFNLEQQKAEVKTNIEKQKSIVAEKQHTIEEIKGNIQTKKRLITLKQTNIEMYKRLKAEAESRKDAAMVAQYNKEISLAIAQQKKYQTELDTLEKEELPRAEAELKTESDKLVIYEKQEKLLQSQDGLINNMITGFTGLIIPIMAIVKLYKTLTRAINTAIILKKKENAETQKGTALERIKTAWEMAGSSAKIPMVGWIIAGVILATIIGVSIGAAVAMANAGNKAKDSSESINEMSKAIYDLNKKSQELDSVIKKFEDLDNKVLKTNADLEEMHKLLESAGDSLSDEEKDVFSTLQTDQAKKEFLESVQDAATSELGAKRSEQRETILNLRNKGGQKWSNWLTSTKAEDIQARDAMYALNNAYLYQQIDNLNIDKERAKVIENITQNMLTQLKAEKAAALLANQSQIDTYIGALAGQGDAAETLASEDKTIRERVEAFKKLHQAMADLGDDAILEAFDTVNKEWSMFAEFSNEALDYMDHLGANIDGINELAKAIQKTGVNAEMSAQMIGALFEELEHGSDLASTITDLFGSENFDAILNAYDKAFGTTILNMGQNVDKFRNTVNSFYEKSKEWSSMSETDKTSFLSENAELFKGDTGAALLAAFENGNYAEIEAALAGNAALIKQREQLLKDVNRQLEIEMARSAEERDNAYIKELEEYKRQLEDLDSVYLASLKMRYEQQQAQLDKYKEYLQKESEALQDSLNKRKDAYQKYFDAINQEEEREEYEDKANTLIANISKLSSSTNADAIAKTADLTKQLEDLEKERLKELRQQAQEAVIKGIEDKVTKISDNLEKLLNNEQALLNAMTNDASNPQQMIASMLSAQFASGNNTELGMQSYLQEMQSTFAAIMPGVDWSQVDVERSGDSLVLNILGKEITLTDGEQQTIYDAIQSALKQLGYN